MNRNPRLLARVLGTGRPVSAAGILRTAAAFAVGLIVAGCIEPGEGRVVDSETGRPIAAASVRFRCQVGVNLESWKTIAVLETVTDQNGAYRFGSSDTWKCDSGVLSANKAGYESLSPDELIWRTVGGYTFQLAPAAEATLRRLKILHSATIKDATNARTHPFSSPGAEYQWVYLRFMQSRSIAKTPDANAFIAQNYCARLAALHATLSPAERAQLVNKEEWVTMPSTALRVRFDHEANVVAYCAGRG
jgi:hypothetical protein